MSEDISPLSSDLREEILPCGKIADVLDSLFELRELVHIDIVEVPLPPPRG